MMFSIIVPVYNAERYLTQCVESILSQTLKNFEVILVDDGSSDDSAKICDDFAKQDSRIVVIHKQNQGVSEARNTGLSFAKGDWIVFVDSDDYLKETHLADFKIENNKDAELIIQGSEYIDSNSGDVIRIRRYDDCSFSLSSFTPQQENLLFSTGVPWSKAYKREVIVCANLRFDSRLSFQEDHLFVIDYINLISQVAFTDGVSYIYRCMHSENSLSKKKQDWRKYLLTSQLLIQSLKQSENKFLQPNSLTWQQVFTYVSNLNLSAINVAYESCSSYYDFKVIFKQIIKRDELKEYYYPKDFRHKIDKLVFGYMPVCIIYQFVKILNYKNNR